MDPVRPKFLKAEPAAKSAKPAQATSGARRPVIPPDVPQYFIPLRTSSGEGLVYVPVVYGAAEVHITDTKSKVDTTITAYAVCSITNNPVPVNWDEAQSSDVETTDLDNEPSQPEASFGELPSIATKAKSYANWSKDFANWIYRTQELTVFKSPSSGISSSEGESERDFRVRLLQATRESRDQEVDAMRKKYAAKTSTLEDRIRRAQQAQAVQEEQAKSAKMQTAISFGTTLLSGLLGRKAMSLGTIGRASTAARGVSRSMKESADVTRAAENIGALQQQLQEINVQLESEINQLMSTSDPTTEQLETVSIKPKKKDINIKLIALAWLPVSKGK
jgi:hypothetical protein